MVTFASVLLQKLIEEIILHRQQHKLLIQCKGTGQINVSWHGLEILTWLAMVASLADAPMGWTASKIAARPAAASLCPVLWSSSPLQCAL